VKAFLPGVFHPAPLTGTYAPGHYFFEPTFGVFGGEASGAFSFVLSAIQNPGHQNVPDAGSTVTLLGMALGGLCFFIRQRI
jgi:VPDSG-CTERM motif